MKRSPYFIRSKFLRPAQFACVSATSHYAESAECAWSTMFDWLACRGHMLRVGRGYGLAYDDPRTTAPDHIRYDACVRVPLTWRDEDEQYVTLKKFKGGAYALARQVGPYEDLGRLVSSIRNDWLPRQNLLTDAGRPVLYIFHSDPRVVAPDLRKADVGVPIVPERRLDGPRLT